MYFDLRTLFWLAVALIMAAGAVGLLVGLVL